MMNVSKTVVIMTLLIGRCKTMLAKKYDERIFINIFAHCKQIYYIMRVIISGGGTGGHIFPAIAIANELKRRDPETAVLFVGAKDRMEMEKVPQAGYEIEGLWISGIQRKLTFKNTLLPIKWAQSLWRSWNIIKRFKPTVVIGVGGYASAAVLFVASKMGIPTLIQEQNSYAGLTNKFLGKNVHTICVAYPEMEKYFPAKKIVYTGNPVRSTLSENMHSPQESRHILGLQTDKPTLFITGGSLGARTINQGIAHNLQQLVGLGWQLYWQTGSTHYDLYKHLNQEGVVVTAFVKEMGVAYAAADLVICRAGALTISELCVLGKPALLVPSPYVAEDHQTHNAMQLFKHNAALISKDATFSKDLISILSQISANESMLKNLSSNAKLMAKPNATAQIVDEIYKLV